MDDVGWLSEREERAWRGLQLMQMRLERELARQLAADSGLSYPDYLVLVALTDSPDGRMRLFELGELLSWEKSRLSHHVNRMTKRDLVTKEPCDDDRRGALLCMFGQQIQTLEFRAGRLGHKQCDRSGHISLQPGGSSGRRRQQFTGRGQNTHTGLFRGQGSARK